MARTRAVTGRHADTGTGRPPAHRFGPRECGGRRIGWTRRPAIPPQLT